MKKFLNTIFGVPFMATLLIVFAVAIGYATFIEDAYGTTASKALIYNAKWFEAIMVVLSISLILNIFRYKMYRWAKMPVFLFHLSFLFIILGASFTRYNSYSGIMHIREGASSDYFSSSDVFLKTKISDADNTHVHYTKALLSVVSKGHLSGVFTVGDNKLKVRSTNFIPQAGGHLIRSETGSPVAHFMISTASSRQEFFLRQGDIIKISDKYISFADYADSFVELKSENGQLFIKSSTSGMLKSMGTAADSAIVANKFHLFNNRMLYDFEDALLVLIDYQSKGDVVFFSDTDSKTRKPDVVELSLSYMGMERSIHVIGGSGFQTIPYVVEDQGDTFEFSYGARYYKLPFSVHLDDFIIERYPGSSSPSSFISNVKVLDKGLEAPFEYSIYMNHIMNYNGYRFFQSSYDTDELGTILSVNYDVLGMRTTYLGYFLMIAGMLIALFWKGSQFRGLLKKLSSFQQKSAMMLVLLLGIPFFSFSQNEGLYVPDADQADKFGHLWIQEKEGRIKPLQSYNIDLLRKIYGKSSYKGYSANQVVLGMMADAETWADEPIIKVANRDLAKRLGVEGKYASFRDFFDLENGATYKMRSILSQSHKKYLGEQSKFDQDVIKVDERVNIFTMIQYQVLFAIFPDPDDDQAPWLASNSNLEGKTDMDSIFVKTALTMYLGYLEAGESDNADFMIEGMKQYQNKVAANVLPSDKQMKFEILYDQYNVFSKLAIVYLLLGILALFLVFGYIFSEKAKPGFSIQTLKILLWLALIIHGAGIGIRWYISGHAPFSNGYEAMIFVSWSGLLAGMLLSRKSLLLIPVSTLFAAAPLLVAYLTMMNPDITNLVPVLKSYWLSIHVATITASYGVLGSVFIGSLLAIILMLFKNDGNKQKIDKVIGELTTLNQLSTILGLYLLTIGCFLGGIWANESWGTYWSWDPKETWCLVSILVYSFTAHIKFIPGLQTNFAFNFTAFWSYSAIIMTYFGVNYFLGGMHSYAKGDAMGIHYGYYIAVAILFIISIAAGIRERKYGENLS